MVGLLNAIGDTLQCASFAPDRGIQVFTLVEAAVDVYIIVNITHYGGVYAHECRSGRCVDE